MFSRVLIPSVIQCSRKHMVRCYNINAQERMCSLVNRWAPVGQYHQFTVFWLVNINHWHWYCVLIGQQDQGGGVHERDGAETRAELQWQCRGEFWLVNIVDTLLWLVNIVDTLLWLVNYYQVAGILDSARVLWDAVNIVTDTNAELAIREYSGGDTRIPLIFLRGECLGGVAELREAHQSGRLEQIFNKIGVKRRTARWQIQVVKHNKRVSNTWMKSPPRH